MTTKESTQAVNRLAEIKRMALEELRADMVRLESLADRAEQQLEKQRSSLMEFHEEVAAKQAAGARIDPSRLVGQRVYAEHLSAQIQESMDAHARLVQRREEARADVNALYTEVRLLERVADRKETLIEAEQRRRDYATADDAEMQRHERMRRNADADV